MEAEKYICPHCGMQIPIGDIDFKTRKAFCIFCYQSSIFPKKSSIASSSPIEVLEDAIRFFLDNNFESANNCAEKAVVMMPNNVVALYIVAYYKAYVAGIKEVDSMNSLFNTTLPDAEFEIEEEKTFKKLLTWNMFHSIDYEENILKKFAEYDDAKELEEFVEGFSPFLIGKRTNIDWFTSEIVKIYTKISAVADIPKTWYALLLSISQNPDSPIKESSFYLKTKSLRFYNDYVVPIGKIFEKIKNQELKVKFLSAYEKLDKQFKIGLGL